MDVSIKGSFPYPRNPERFDHPHPPAPPVNPAAPAAPLNLNAVSPPPDPLHLFYSPDAIAHKSGMIRNLLMQVSDACANADIAALSPADIAFAFKLYDTLFFHGWFARTLPPKSDAPLHFRVSANMTSAGGKTITRRFKVFPGKFRCEYEIAVSGHLLRTNFHDPAESVRIGGLPCPDRVSALQRILEHEIIHLLELLSHGKSSCAKPPFKSLVSNIFGHTESRHGLLTAAQRACRDHALHVGSAVEFNRHARVYRGIISRITARVTVLVPDGRGRLYTDGRRYVKYYVPLDCLRPAAPAASFTALPDELCG